MSERDELERRMRHRIVGLMHAGRLRAGDRLPSIRQVAGESGADHRAVAAAYRQLEREGLVEVRPSSGVYVAGEEVRVTLAEQVRWLAEVLLEGWERGRSRAEMGELVRRCAAAQMRCGCVESNRDHMVAIAAELEESFSLQVRPLHVEPDARVLEPGRLDGLDLVVTSQFHADLVRLPARAAGLPVVVTTFHPEFVLELDRRLSRHPVTAVISDPRFAARGQAYLDVTAHRGRVRFVLADQVEAEGLDLEDETVALSRAARRELGLEEFHFVRPPPGVLSRETARELSRVVVRLALGGAGTAGAGRGAAAR